MKKHKTECTALILLLGILCYAFYDSNIKGSEQSIVLTNELFTMREIESKEDITIEMLTLDKEESKDSALVENLLIQNNKREENNTDKEVNDNRNTYSINLEAEVEDVPYNEVISNQVVNYALKFEGNPYVYGGNSLTKGTDCSGFTKLVYAEYGISLPRTSRAQSKAGTRVGLKNIMPGDLVFSGYNGRIHHVSIYIGNNKLVHALNSDVGIVVSKLHIMPILDVRRVI